MIPLFGANNRFPFSSRVLRLLVSCDFLYCSYDDSIDLLAWFKHSFNVYNQRSAGLFLCEISFPIIKSSGLFGLNPIFNSNGVHPMLLFFALFFPSLLES